MSRSTRNEPPDSAATASPAAGEPEAGAARPDEAATPPGPAPGPVRLHQRLYDTDFRDAVADARRACVSSLTTVGVFSLATNILVLAVPLYLFQVSDRVLTSRSTDTLIMLTVIAIGALALYVLLDVARRLVMSRMAIAVETKLGGPVLAAATRASQSSSMREFQALSDLQQLRAFIAGPVPLTLFDAPVAPIYFLAIYLIHPQLCAIAVLSTLALVVLAVVTQRVTAVPMARSNAFALRAHIQSEAMARNARIVNAMGMIREGVILWGREMAEALKAQVTANDRNTYLAGASKLVRLATQIAMLGWGAWLALRGEVTGGMLIAASIIGSRALAPIEGLIEGWRGIAQARSGWARIAGLLAGTPLAHDRLTLPRVEGRLSVERVLFVPPPTKKVILNGINFTLEPGESLAIVGPSGTGKSTLARMLVGSIAPTSGSVRLDLMDIRNWDPRQLGVSIGYLPQDVELFPATIKANIARMREDVADADIFEAAELAGVHQMIAELPQGYETVVGLDGSPLSGGQKQRIGLARAFFGGPKLLVLDEPNSNLDTSGEAALAAAMRHAKQRRMTVVAVTQRPSLLASVDRIMLLDGGRVQAFGRRDEIMPQLGGRRGPALSRPPAGRAPDGPATESEGDQP